MPDNLKNIDRLQVLSPAAMQLLQDYGAAQLEYLPVVVEGPDGEVIDDRYVIANPLDPVECLDVARCQGKKRFGSQHIGRVRKLRFVERWLTSPNELCIGRAVFRPKWFHQITLVERALAVAISEARLSGFRWQEIVDYPHVGASR